MSNLNFKDFLPLEVSEILSQTTYLTTEEFGAYMLLLMNFFKSQANLPESDNRLAMVARLPLERWQKLKPTVMKLFDEQRDEDDDEKTKDYCHVDLLYGMHRVREFLEDKNKEEVVIK